MTQRTQIGRKVYVLLYLIKGRVGSELKLLTLIGVVCERGCHSWYKIVCMFSCVLKETQDLLFSCSFGITAT